MRTLIYKSTHTGDPDPENGVFGCHNCMGCVRAWDFDSVIGVGGIGPEAARNRLKGKLTWIGQGANKKGKGKELLVTFEHFIHYGETGQHLRDLAPNLAKRIYGRNIRATTDQNFTGEERNEVSKLLEMAKASEALQFHLLRIPSTQSETRCRKSTGRTKCAKRMRTAPCGRRT